MFNHRAVPAACLSVSLAVAQFSPVAAANVPLGVLTQATHAYLDQSVASEGLSVFDGERLWTAAEGQLGVRAGRAIIALASRTDVTLFHAIDGMHVDMAAGALYFSAPDSEAIDVHAEEALLRPQSAQPTQARISILAPKVLQVTTVHNGLNFSYRDEFRNLPEGQTYRIYLDAPAEPQIAAGSGGIKSSIVGKVAYFIVGAGIGSAVAWKVRDRNSSGSAPESPWRP